jgi:hypothetical protein
MRLQLLIEIAKLKATGSHRIEVLQRFLGFDLQAISPAFELTSGCKQASLQGCCVSQEGLLLSSFNFTPSYPRSKDTSSPSDIERFDSGLPPERSI